MLERMKKLIEDIENFENLGEEAKVKEGIAELAQLAKELDNEANPKPQFSF